MIIAEGDAVSIRLFTIHNYGCTIGNNVAYIYIDVDTDKAHKILDVISKCL